MPHRRLRHLHRGGGRRQRSGGFLDQVQPTSAVLLTFQQQCIVQSGGRPLPDLGEQLQVLGVLGPRADGARRSEQADHASARRQRHQHHGEHVQPAPHGPLLGIGRALDVVALVDLDQPRFAAGQRGPGVGPSTVERPHQVFGLDRVAGHRAHAVPAVLMDLDQPGEVHHPLVHQRADQDLPASLHGRLPVHRAADHREESLAFPITMAGVDVQAAADVAVAPIGRAAVEHPPVPAVTAAQPDAGAIREPSAAGLHRFALPTGQTPLLDEAGFLRSPVDDWPLGPDDVRPRPVVELLGDVQGTRTPRAERPNDQCRTADPGRPGTQAGRRLRAGRTRVRGRARPGRCGRPLTYCSGWKRG